MPRRALLLVDAPNVVAWAKQHQDYAITGANHINWSLLHSACFQLAAAGEFMEATAFTNVYDPDRYGNSQKVQMVKRQLAARFEVYVRPKLAAHTDIDPVILRHICIRGFGGDLTRVILVSNDVKPDRLWQLREIRARFGISIELVVQSGFVPSTLERIKRAGFLVHPFEELAASLIIQRPMPRGRPRPRPVPVQSSLPPLKQELPKIVPRHAPPRKKEERADRSWRSLNLFGLPDQGVWLRLCGVDPSSYRVREYAPYSVARSGRDAQSTVRLIDHLMNSDARHRLLTRPASA